METKRFWIGVSFVILSVLSASNIILLLYVVPKFEQIYKDALPSLHLPALTQFIITARIALAIIDLAGPILGAVLIRQQKSSANLWINLGILWAFFQLGITMFALVSPMIGFHGGMGEGK